METITLQSPQIARAAAHLGSTRYTTRGLWLATPALSALVAGMTAKPRPETERHTSPGELYPDRIPPRYIVGKLGEGEFAVLDTHATTAPRTVQTYTRRGNAAARADKLNAQAKYERTEGGA